MNANLVKDSATLILNARRSARLTELPEALRPRNEAEAYAIQDALLPSHAIIGWKVAPASAAKGHRCSPIAAADASENSGAIAPDATSPEIEAEVALVLKENLDGRKLVGRSDLLNAVSGACLAIEVLDSCFTDRKRVDELSALADRQSNAGLVFGPLATDWRARDLADVRPMFNIVRGGEIAMTKAAPSTDAVLDAVVWLANHAADRGRPLRAGQIIITGARVGPMPIAPGQTFMASADGFESVSIWRG